MLSTLNHYQRVRKHNETMIKELFETNDVRFKQTLQLLIKENITFSVALPFTLLFDSFELNEIGLFFKARKKFDNELIRIAVSYHDKYALKDLLDKYIKIEEHTLLC
jgi:hypothetical protein